MQTFRMKLSFKWSIFFVSASINSKIVDNLRTTFHLQERRIFRLLVRSEVRSYFNNSLNWLLCLSRWLMYVIKEIICCKSFYSPTCINHYNQSLIQRLLLHYRFLHNTELFFPLSHTLVKKLIESVKIL